MNNADAIEATAIIGRTMDVMLMQAPTSGLPGVNLRTAVGDLMAYATAQLQADTAGPLIWACYAAAVATGMTLPQMDIVRQASVAEFVWKDINGNVVPYGSAAAYQATPVLPGAVLIANTLIEFALVAQGQIIAAMTFVSRQDVEAVLAQMNDSFAFAEEQAADGMDSMVYQQLVGLHSAVTAYLVATARPLARMVFYQFSRSMPTLVMAYRLYADASRADELLAENKVVHPAFAPRIGRALSQ